MTKQQAKVVNDVTGKSFEKLTDDELASLSTEIETRRKALREAQQKEQFNALATAAKKMADVLGWEKLPKITLTPDVAGKKYEVSIPTAKVNGPGKRAKSGVNSGDVTVKKIADAKGGLAKFKYNGNEYQNIQDLVKALKQPDGTPESERCWDIQHKLGVDKGISASDIVIKYHADHVTLVFNDGKERILKDEVEEFKKARAVA